MLKKPLYMLFVFFILLTGCHSISKNNIDNATNLVLSNRWYISGPTIEQEDLLNSIRKKDSIIRVTANNSPTGEIELNFMVTPTTSNNGPPTKLDNQSTFLQITYKSSHLIKLQAREGNELRTGCIHGGSHPRVDLLPSPEKFTTINIPWTGFRLDGKPDGKLLNINNLCKFNFVNYNPVAKATLEIVSVKIEGFRL